MTMVLGDVAAATIFAGVAGMLSKGSGSGLLLLSLGQPVSENIIAARTIIPENKRFFIKNS
jgi:hypothetical protein